MDELKPDPCPFCGSEDVEVYGLGVNCHDCGACGPIGEDEQDGIAQWNKVPRS